ncbi:hypothetical protein DXC92_06675 [Clostridiales bacterium TF09-2AC]|nr:hypothetical protein DXC92_06675 [Clostridiales bacterium TF09-2AC]
MVSAALSGTNFPWTRTSHPCSCSAGNDVTGSKSLLHEPDGYVLLYKRLSVTQGRYRWPRKSSEAQAITWCQLDWLLSGLDIEQPKAIQTS